MSLDKLVDSTQLDSDLTSVANAIRAKGGTSASLAFPAGFVSAIGNIPGWKKLYGTTATLNTTSTSATKVVDIDTAGIWTSSKIIYVRVRDSAGKRSGYFYGTDNFLINFNPQSGATSTYNFSFRQLYNYNGSSWGGGVTTGAIGYGVFAAYVDPANGKGIRINVRYNTSSSLTINGTYSIEVYSLDWPDNVSPFDAPDAV